MRTDTNTLTPTQLEKEGQVAYQQQEYAAAAESFSAAEEGYRAKGEQHKAAQMANNRSVALLQAGEHQAALDAVSETIAVFRGAGDRYHQAMAMGNRAAALEALGQFEAAIADYEDAADKFDQIGENDLRLDVLKSLSALQLRRGKTIQALNTMQSGLANLEKPTFKQRVLKKISTLPSRLLR